MFFMTVHPVQADVPETCDTDYFDVLKVQAELQGKQDLELAQRFIKKPYSVLQYSCFLDMAGLVAGSGAFGSNTVGIVQASVATAAQQYLNNNFGGVLPCGTMKQVWDYAKCENYQASSFATFQNWASNDRRTYPSACPDSAARTAQIETAMAVVDGKAGNDGNADVLDTYQTALTSCGTPIPTGLAIVRGSTVTAEKTCLSPGCYFNGAACVPR